MHRNKHWRAAVFEKQNIQETISKLNSDTVKGLTEGEAFRRLRQNGRNEMRAARKKTKIQLFLEQLKDPLIYILLIAAVVSILLGEVSDALIIGTVVLVNALVGMLQEGKARKALEALRKLTTPRTIVIRDGIRREIPAAELVTGDLVELEAGARVPADIRLTRSANLQVEESALTGESVPVEKDALFLADCRQEIPLTERVNMVYMSTVVTNGHGEGLVVATGMDTEIGRIASMITDTEGASAVFPGGYVTYLNKTKILCGVDEKIIKEHGVYSKQCARAMAETAQKNLHTEIAVGITGTTGNVDPNNADSMQGKVFFCILVGENAYDYEYNAEVTRMSRHEIKELYADKVFEELAKLINIVHSSSDLCCDSV